MNPQELDAIRRIISGDPDTWASGQLAELLASLEKPSYTIKDGIVVDDRVHYWPMDTCPLGTVQVLSVGNINTKMVITKDTDLSQFKGWCPLPRKPKE